MSDIEFEPGATFSEEENRKVEEVIQAEMEVDGQELEQCKHVLVIPPGGEKGEFLRLEVGQGMILKKKKKPVVPVVLQQMEKKGKKPPEPEKKLAEKKKGMWVQRAAAPPPPRCQPEQNKQQPGEKK